MRRNVLRILWTTPCCDFTLFIFLNLVFDLKRIFTQSSNKSVLIRRRKRGLMFICLLRLWTHVRGACLSRLLVIRCMDTSLQTVPLFPSATCGPSTQTGTWRHLKPIWSTRRAWIPVLHCALCDLFNLITLYFRDDFMDMRKITQAAGD